MLRNMLKACSAALLALGLMAGPARAQTRVFVAAQGTDTNPCTFALPCRTFQHAHDVLAANGEIDVLDPAGYGALSISKPISIQGHGFAGISAPSGDAITVQSGLTGNISLHGVLLDGVGSGGHGINAGTNAISTLDIQDCTIRNFTQGGISFVSTGGGVLQVANTHIAANGVGISVSGKVSGILDHVQIVSNLHNGGEFGTGFLTLVLTVANSLISHNGENGIFASSVGGPAIVLVRDTTIAYNAGSGLLALNSGADIVVSRSTITGNNVGLTHSGGAIESFQNNDVHGNTTDGTTTGTITPL